MTGRAKQQDGGERGRPGTTPRVYERAGVREYWLVHPGDRLATIYRLGPEGYGKPAVQEPSGETPVGAPPEVSIRWDDLIARLPAPED